MKIYNFFDKNWRGSFGVCVLVTIVCFVVVVIQCVHYIREKIMNQGFSNWLYEVIGIFPIIAMLCISIIFCVNSLRMGRVLLPTLTGKEKMVVGELTKIEIVANDYRGEKEYDIMFEINEIKFQKTINIFSESEMTAILENEGGRVKVIYAEQEDNFVVYTIELMQ